MHDMPPLPQLLLMLWVVTTVAGMVSSAFYFLFILFENRSEKVVKVVSILLIVGVYFTVNIDELCQLFPQFWYEASAPASFNVALATGTLGGLFHSQTQKHRSDLLSAFLLVFAVSLSSFMANTVLLYRPDLPLLHSYSEQLYRTDFGHPIWAFKIAQSAICPFLIWLRNRMKGEAGRHF